MSDQVGNGNGLFYHSLAQISDEIACADPKKCHDICNNEAGCANIAYPLLVLRVLPAGNRKLFVF